MFDANTERCGEYQLIRLIGKGGMGAVYEAQGSDGERVALKVFTNSGANREFLKKRFLAEWKLLSRLDHPRLVKVRKFGIDENSGCPYFSMDLILGPSGSPQTLEDYRRQVSCDENRVASFYADLRDGVAYLHAKGIAHRDIKLENVLVDSDGHAVLSDFGISRICDGDLRHELAVTTTMASEHAPIMGSFGYLAPELKAGNPATPSSDAFALGVLVFRLLTGVWYEPDSTAWDLLEGFDPIWASVLRRLLDEDPSRRLPMPERIQVGKTARQRRMRRLCLATALAIAVVTAVLIYLRSRPPHYEFDEFFPPLNSLSTNLNQSTISE